MTKSPQKYTGILLDATFFFPLRPELTRLLGRTPLWVCATWQTTVALLGELLTGAEKAVYLENLSYLRAQKPRQMPGVRSDLFGTVLTLAARPAERWLLVTADQTLLQRVILEDLPIDLYDLFQDTHIPRSAFPARRRELELEWSDRVCPTVDILQADPLVLYDETWNPIRLEKAHRFAEGREAYLYRCPGQPDRCIKLFRQPNSREAFLTPEKLGHIRRLQKAFSDRGPGFWATVPVGLIYDENHDPVGFQMYTTAATEPISSDDYLHRTQNRVPIFRVLQRCVSLVVQMMYLNVYGFYVCDFNSGNFRCMGDGAQVVMLDADSFSSGNFCTTCRDGGENHIHILRRGQSTKLDALQCSLEHGYTFVGSALMLMRPLFLLDGRLREDSMWELLPPNVAQLLQTALGELTSPEHYLPSYDLLLYELCAALSQDPWQRLYYDGYLPEWGDPIENPYQAGFRVPNAPQQQPKPEPKSEPQSEPESGLKPEPAPQTPQPEPVQEPGWEPEPLVLPAVPSAYFVSDRHFSPDPLSGVKHPRPPHWNQEPYSDPVEEVFPVPAPLRELYSPAPPKKTVSPFWMGLAAVMAALNLVLGTMLLDNKGLLPDWQDIVQVFDRPAPSEPPAPPPADLPLPTEPRPAEPRKGLWTLHPELMPEVLPK